MQIKKKLDKGKANAIETSGSNNKVHDKANFSRNMGMDLECESWIGNKEQSSSNQDEIFEEIDYTKNFYCWQYNKIMEKRISV